MTSEPEPTILDLTPYQTETGHWLSPATVCPTAYTDVAKKHMGGKNLTLNFFLFGAFVSRMRGLHEGAVRELTHNNPHAVLPLNRAWLETVTVGLYLLRKPTYAQQLLFGPGGNRPARKSFESMFHAVREDAAQLKLVYKGLSDYSHFGPLGVWNAYSVESEDDGMVSWTDVPRWKSEPEFQSACAQANELAVVGLQTLDRLGATLLPAFPTRESRLRDHIEEA